MIKIIMILLILWPSISFADVSGYLFLGKYLDYKPSDLEDRKIAYRAGIHLEMESELATVFIRDETLIEDIDNGKSYPVQINYILGIKKEIGAFELIFKHECLHPVDGTSGGRKASSYNLIEGRINF